MAVLTRLPLIKTFCISLSKLRGHLFTIFTVYIVFEFRHVSSIHVLAIDFRRGRGHSTVRSIALHTVCGGSVYKVSRMDRVISTVYPLCIDTMQKIGVWEWVVI